MQIGTMAIKQDTTHFAARFASSSTNRPATENWEAFKHHLMKVMDSHIPSRMSRSKEQLPWITAVIKEGHTQKEQAAH